MEGAVAPVKRDGAPAGPSAAVRLFLCTLLVQRTGEPRRTTSGISGGSAKGERRHRCWQQDTAALVIVLFSTVLCTWYSVLSQCHLFFGPETFSASRNSLQEKNFLRVIGKPLPRCFWGTVHTYIQPSHFTPAVFQRDAYSERHRKKIKLFFSVKSGLVFLRFCRNEILTPHNALLL